MLKFGGGFALGFVVGFMTLFALMMAFGDYGQSAQAQPDVVTGPSPTPPIETPASDTVTVSASDPLPTLPPTPTPAPTFTPVPTETPSPVPTATPVPVALHQDLTLDGIRWTAIDVQEVGNTLQGDEWTDDATTEGKFVRVTLNVENRRTEPDGGYEAPDLIDGQGRRFRPFEERFYYLPDAESCTLETFNPNLTRTCTEIYAVAADSTGMYKLVVNNFEFIDALEAIIELR